MTNQNQQTIKAINKIKTTIQTVIPRKATLVLAISGGPDSMFLLELMRQMQTTAGFELIVAHVEHGMRLLGSKKDRNFVEAIAKKYNLKFETISLKIQKKYFSKASNLEEEARKARYQFLESIRKKHNAYAILTGHHLNDNIETVLFNLVRGANYNGLKGIETYSPTTKIFRPLLEITKPEILTYLKTNKIRYCIDSTNSNQKYSRNLIRQKIIPTLKKINSNFENTLHENLKNFAQINQLLENLADEWLKNNFKKFKFISEKFLIQNISLQKEIIAKIYKQLYGSTNKLTGRHLEAVLNLIQAKKSGLKKEFGTDYTVKITRINSTSPHQVEFIRKHH